MLTSEEIDEAAKFYNILHPGSNFHKLSIENQLKYSNGLKTIKEQIIKEHMLKWANSRSDTGISLGRHS